jgi:hypothetical protein
MTPAWEHDPRRLVTDPAEGSAESAQSAESRVTEDSAGSADSAETSPPLWEPPTPLTRAGQPPAFPVEAFPDWLSDYVQAEAVATQTPVDLPAMMALATLAAAGGGLYRIQVRPGWQEPLNLYVVVAMPPGSRKTQVVGDVTRPLVRYDEDEAKRMAAIILQETTGKRIAERAADAAQAAAGKASDAERDQLTADALAAAERAASIHVPPVPRMLADDVTPEALASLMADSPYDRMAMLADEGGVFDMMAGRYSNKGPNLDIYLKGHAGTLPHRVDRQGRPPEYIQRPTLTIGLAIQPDVLWACKDQPGFRGRGLLARFAYAIPANTVGYRNVSAPPVPPDTAGHYHDQVQILARSLLQEAETARLEDPDQLPMLSLAPDATALLLAFAAEIEPRLAPDQGDLGHIADWAGKLVGAVARIAGLLHLAERLETGWGDPVSADTTADAILVGRYLIEHALTAFGSMGSDPLLNDALYVLNWIERNATEQISRRDLFTALPRGRFPKAPDLDPALILLESHGYLRRVEQPKPKGAGRPPSPVYEVNPLWER